MRESGIGIRDSRSVAESLLAPACPDPSGRTRGYVGITREWGFGNRDSGIVIRDSGFVIRESLFVIRDSGIGDRESGIAERSGVPACPCLSRSFGKNSGKPRDYSGIGIRESGIGDRGSGIGNRYS